MRSPLSPVRLVLALTLVALPAFARDAALPSVVRPVYAAGRDTRVAGTAFFIPGPGEIGVVAVATAHAFPVGELEHASEVEFKLAAAGERIAVSSGLMVPPGRPFRDAGATLRGDFMVFALDLKPHGVRVLDPATALPATGTRVRLLGVPSEIAQDEDDLFGTVKESSDDRIEVELDAAADLRGWGGAPVLTHPEGRVVGLLQAARPESGTLRVTVSPIAAITDALRSPLDGGRGRPFASAFGEAPRIAAAPGAPKRAAAGAATSPAPAAATAAPAPGAAAGTAPDDATAGLPARDRRMATARPKDEPLLGHDPNAKPVIQLSIEKPSAGEVVGDANGAFVSGRAVALLGEFKKFDVAIVIDTSGSTAEASGADINGNGVVGKNRGGGVGSVFGLGSTDAGDSVLAAEVAAARQLLHGLDPRSTRVTLISFSGQPPDGGGGLFGGREPSPAITEEPLTTDYGRIEDALTHVLERGPDGATHIAAAVDQATIELLGLRGGLSKPDKNSEKIVLFLTDGQPTLPYGPGYDRDNVRAVLRAADRAHRAGVRVFSFGIGPEALDGPVACVELSARTGGEFTPVRSPGDIVQVVERVGFANIESIRIRNETTGTDADLMNQSADGGFSALVPLRAGKNEIAVVARTSDGVERREVVSVQYAPGTPEPTLPATLLAQRNRLLEQKLLELRRGRIEAERAKTEETRKELALEIERERAKAQERAAQQRKELDLDVEPETPPAGR